MRRRSECSPHGDQCIFFAYRLTRSSNDDPSGGELVRRSCAKKRADVAVSAKKECMSTSRSHLVREFHVYFAVQKTQGMRSQTRMALHLLVHNIPYHHYKDFACIFMVW